VPTWFTSEGVFKGPFSPDSVVPMIVKERYQLHRQLGNNSVLQPTPVGSFIRFDYFGEPPDLGGKSEPYTWRGISTRILDRSTHPAVQAHRYPFLGPLVGDILFHLCVCYAVGSGDVGLFNILVYKDKIAGIDMEEFRQKTPTQPTDIIEALFTRTPSKHQVDAIRVYLDKHSGELALRLKTALKTVPDKISAILRVTSEVLKTRLETLIQLVDHVDPVVDPVGQVKRRFPSLYTARSPCGLSGHVLCSMLQKCVRRGMVKDALDSFADGYAAGPPISTLLQNRVRVIALEDIGIANLPLATTVVELVNESPSREQLAWAIEAMCNSRKTRISSLLFNAYCTDAGRKLQQHLEDTHSGTPFDLVLKKDPNAIRLFLKNLDLSDAAAGKAFFSSFKGRVDGRVVNVVQTAYLKRKASRDVKFFFLFIILALMYVEGVTMVPFVKVGFRDLLAPIHLVVPDFAFDVHTAEGKRKGKNIVDFALDGVQLSQEWNPNGVNVNELKRIYLHVKCEQLKVNEPRKKIRV